MKKSLPMLDIIGCSREELATWMESNFDADMNWENLGKKWQIDHVIPIQAFDLTATEGQKACFHWSNLYPLDLKQNQHKGKQIWADFALDVQKKAEMFVQSKEKV